MREGRIQQAIIGPPAKRHLMAFRWRADDGQMAFRWRADDGQALNSGFVDFGFPGDLDQYC